MCLEFCDQVLHSLQVYWRILHPTTSFKLVGVSYVLGSMQRKEVSTKSRLSGDWRNDFTVGRYFGISQVWSKISYICNLFILSSDLGAVTWKVTDGVFALWEIFPISQQIIMSNLIFTFSLDYLMICLCLHDFACNLT